LVPVPVPVPVLAVGLMVLTAGINEPVAMDEALVPVAETTTVFSVFEATGTFVLVADLRVVERCRFVEQTID
jgi:hypothetical protein